MSDHRAAVGLAVAGAGSVATYVQDHVAGWSVSGVVAAMIALSGGAYVAYGNVRKLVEARGEARREERRKDALADLEIERHRREAEARWEAEHAVSLAGKIDSLTRALVEQADDHRREAEAAARYQAESKASLDLMRASLHAARDQLQGLTSERDLLRQQLAESNARLAALSAVAGRTEHKADQIAEAVSHLAPEVPPPPEPAP